MIFLFVSCRQVIDLEITSTDQLIVVEGFLEASDSIHHIQLSETVGFSSSAISPPITDAKVTVISSDSEVFSFTHVNNGRYESVVIELTQNVSYHLEVVLANGRRLISESEIVNQPALIDSIHYQQIEIDDPESNKDQLIRFFPIVFGEDRLETKDYYVWKVYRNDTLFDQAEQLILIEDRFFNGNEFRNDFTNFLFDFDDEITLEVQTVSNSAYSYLEQFKEHQLNQRNNQPSNPNRLIGNISTDGNSTEVILGNFAITNSKFFRKKIK